MKFIYFIFGGCILLVAVLVAVAYLCDRFHIGTTARSNSVLFSEQDCQSLAGSDYVEVGNLLILCISRLYSTLGLTRPGDLPLHLAPKNEQVQYKPGIGIVFTYYFDRGANIGSGGGLNLGQLPLSTVATTFMEAKLGVVFPNYCLCAGFGNYSIHKITDISNARVRVEVLRGF